MQENKRKINKDEFYHLIASNANFTLCDVKDIWYTIEQIFEEVIKNDYILDLPGFGKLYVADIAEKKNTWDNINKKRIDLPATKRVVFKLSNNFRSMVKRNK